MGVLARELETLRDALRGWVATARWLWARRPPLPRAVAIAFAAGAGLAGALAVLAQARLLARLPTPQDWAALRALVEREARPGDAAAVSPHWAERAREILPASVPVLAQARYAGEDLVGVRRVWLVSIPRAPGFSFDAELDLLQRGPRGEQPGAVGALEVVRYDLALPMIPLAFLPDRLAERRTVRGDVAREVREIGGGPRPCVVARVGGGEPVAVPTSPVRIGRVVRGHVGAIGATALPAPVRVAVHVDGDEVGAAEVSGPGFVAFQVDTVRLAGHERPLTLVLTTPGAPAEVCLDAVTLP